LKKTFECFGFEVIRRHNTRASDLVKEILFFTQKLMSCYVVAILSHGERSKYGIPSQEIFGNTGQFMALFFFFQMLSKEVTEEM